MIRITFTQGNGYRCSCCRRTHQDYVEFQTEAEAVDWLSEKESWKKHPPQGDGIWIYPPDDLTVDDIVETKEIFLAADDAKVQALVAERVAKEAEEKAKREAEAEERNRMMYESLKHVYEDEAKEEEKK